MTITNEIRRVSYDGDGSTVAFSYSFRIFAATDLTLTLVDVDGVESAVTGFTVTGVNSASGGTVTVTTAPATGETLIIEMLLPIIQPADIKNQGSFSPSIHEDEFDRIVRQIQQVNAIGGRALHWPTSDHGAVSEIPSVAEMANMFLAFDAFGVPIALPGTGTDAGLREDLALTSGSSLIGVPTPTTTTYLSMLSDIINMEPIDAKRFISRTKHSAIAAGTNTDDLYADVQDMMGAFNTQGGRLHFSRGVYHYDGSFYFDGLQAGNLTISGDGMGLTTLEQTGVGDANALRIAAGTALANDFTALTYYPMTGDVMRGAMSVTLTTVADAGNFALGDKAWIRTRQAISPDANTGQPFAELVEVLSANAGTGVVTFKYPLEKDYILDVSGTIHTHGLALAPAYGNGAPIPNIHIHDFTLRNSGASYAMWLRQMENCIVERVQTFGRAGIVSSAGSTRLIVRDCEINLDDEIPNFLYWLAIDKGAKGLLAKGNTFRSTGAGSLHVHEGCADVTIRDNRFLMPPTAAIAHAFDWPAVSVAGTTWNVRVHNNTFVNGPFLAVRTSNSHKYTEAQHIGFQLTHNHFVGEFGRDHNTVGVGDNCVLLDFQATDHTVIGNTFECTVPAGGFQYKHTGTTTTRRFRGNRFTGDINVGLGMRGDNEFDTYGAPEPVWESRIAASTRGPQVRASLTGAHSPPFWMGNVTDGDWAAFIASSTDTLNLYLGGTPGSSLGTNYYRWNTNGLDALAGALYFVAGLRVVAARKTGWTVATGTATRTAFDTATVTLPELAERVKALLDDLHATAGHGLIGT